MKKKLIYLGGISLVAVAIVFMAYQNSNINKDLRSGFSRNIVTGILTQSKSIDIKFDSWYLAGFTAASIYLGNSEGSSNLFIIKQSLANNVSKSLTAADSIAWRALSIQVDSPYVLATEPVSPAYAFAPLSSMTLTRIPFPRLRYYSICPISLQSAIVIAHDSLSNVNVIMKTVLNKYLEPSIALGKSRQNNFETDGFLLHPPHSNKVVFVYYHRNQIIVTDTSLNFRFSFTTIDTIKQIPIATKYIVSTMMNTAIGNQMVLNTRAFMSDSVLYIQSPRTADNEQKYYDRTTIDRYYLPTGKYLNSFYIPIPVKSVSSIALFDNRLYVIHDRYLTCFQMN